MVDLAVAKLRAQSFRKRRFGHITAGFPGASVAIANFVGVDEEVKGEE